MPGQYSDLVKQFQDGDGEMGRRLNELITTNELLTTLNTARSLPETLNVLLLTILGQYPCRRGGIFIKRNSGWELGIERGLKKQDFPFADFPTDESWDAMPKVLHAAEAADYPPLADFFNDDLFQIALPIRNEGNLVGLIALGRSMLGDITPEKEMHLALIADFGGVIIGNHLYQVDLESVNKQLQRRLFQLSTLYEITGAFSRCFENEEIYQILSSNLMGQFFIAKCAILEAGSPPSIGFQKGLRNLDAYTWEGPELTLPGDFDAKVYQKDEVPHPGVASFMKAHKLEYALPIRSQANHHGLLLLSARFDRKPLHSADRDFIKSISEQAAVAVENVHLQKEVIEKKRLEKELELAREIQQKLLPKQLPNLPGYDLSVEMRPYYLVGGDFYDFYSTPQSTAICLADVSGKSLPASMIMSTAQATLRGLNAHAGLSPKEVMETLNFHLYHSTQSNKYVTMFYAVLDPKTNILTYINAGHNRPILVYPNNSVQLLEKGGMVVGLFPGAKYEVGQVEFEPGCQLLMYTDGLSEVTLPNSEEEFGDDRLIETLLACRECMTAEEARNNIIEAALNFSKNQMVDDLTLCLLRRRKK
jgi:sigma-B regulation protein RsbU (phosphoserine phosphatase)